MRIGILQPGYLPWLGFFEQMYNTDVFVILDDVQYDKKSWRNRNRIRTKDGWIWLTVPVLTKGSFSQRIQDVCINNEIPWQRKHLKSLETNYQKASYYKDHIDFFRELYSKEWKYLLDLDMAVIEYLKAQLKLNAKIFFSSSLYAADPEELEDPAASCRAATCGAKNEKILNICKKLSADILYDGESAESFIDKALFAKEGINIEFQHYNHPVYTQLFQPFMPYMSVIDLLFNCGNASLDIITGS